MAITYNIAKCKGGWGVYIRAISGDDLKSLVDTTVSSVRVVSSRLARKRSKQSAKNYIAKLQSQSVDDQRNLLKISHLKVVPNEYKVIKVQNLKLYREYEPDKFVSLFTTPNKSYAERTALYYSSQNKKSFLRKTVTKYLKVPLNIETSNLNIID